MMTLLTIYFTAILHGVNPDLAAGVARTESQFRADTVTHEPSVGGYSYGIYQLRLGTARDLGFTGTTKELLDPDTNINLGIKYLAACSSKYPGDDRMTLCCYNAGMYRKDYVCKLPQLKQYYKKVLR